MRYKNMPVAAQSFLEKKSLVRDKGVDLEVYQCSGCGLVQLSSDPVPYYKEVIRASFVSKEMEDFRKKQFKSFVKRFALRNKKIIEIGCGRGEYLSIMRQYAKKVYGVEQSRESVKECIRRGLKVFKGFVENSSYKLNYSLFDAFYILSFLEHLPNPNAVLRGIHNNLSKGAVGLVEVPNFNMILRKNLFSEFISDHLLYFTKETLAFTLNLNGFEVIECREVWYDYILSAIVRKKSKLELTHFYAHQARLKAEIRNFLDRYRNVAIWGAGHQALAIIALTGIASRIKYVIDSAPFKQGKYTPASHLPIVSPEMLKLAPVDAIIVMAASYSDEVAKIIQEKYAKKVKVAILRDFGLEVI